MRFITLLLKILNDVTGMGIGQLDFQKAHIRKVTGEESVLYT
jgi:hypothetical protein